MTLAPAYPCAPRYPGRYALYVTRRGDDVGQCMVQVFAAPYAARKFLDALLADDGYVWESDVTIRSETGIIVSTRWFPGRLRECVEHEYTREERDWELDHRHLDAARLFRHGPDVRPTADGGVEPVTRAPRPAPTPRASRDGLVPAADVAAQLGVEARDLRAALRRMKVPKPAAGWAWPETEVPALVAMVRASL